MTLLFTRRVHPEDGEAVVQLKIVDPRQTRLDLGITTRCLPPAGEVRKVPNSENGTAGPALIKKSLGKLKSKEN